MSYQPRRLKELQNSSKKSQQSSRQKQANYRDSLKKGTTKVPMTSEDEELGRMFKNRDKHERPTKAFDYDAGR